MFKTIYPHKNINADALTGGVMNNRVIQLQGWYSKFDFTESNVNRGVVFHF